MEPEQEEILLFDDFFVPKEDTGVPFTLVVRGKTLTFRMKKGISLGDYSFAQAQATRSHISPSGQLVIDSFDQQTQSMELMVRCLLTWPFKEQQADGTFAMVPVTRENIEALQIDVANALSNEMTKLLTQGMDNLAPFVSPSGAAS